MRHFSNVAYELDFPFELASVHLLFCVSLLKKFISDTSSIVPLESVGVKEKLSYEKVTFEIQDCQVQKLTNDEVASIKVLWRNQSIVDATWEGEADMVSCYPPFFTATSDLVWGIISSYELFQNSGILGILMIPYACMLMKSVLMFLF